MSYFNKLKEDSELDYENELTDSNIEIELIKVEDSTMNATAAVKSLMSSVNDSMLLEIMFYFESVDKKIGTCMLKSAGYAESDRSVPLLDAYIMQSFIYPPMLFLHPTTAFTALSSS